MAVEVETAGHEAVEISLDKAESLHEMGDRAGRVDSQGVGDQEEEGGAGGLCTSTPDWNRSLQTINSAFSRIPEQGVREVRRANPASRDNQGKQAQDPRAEAAARPVRPLHQLLRTCRGNLALRVPSGFRATRTMRRWRFSTRPIGSDRT